MEHLLNYYEKHSEEVKKLLNLDNIKVNLKVDGKPFQVVYNNETDELEYHGRSGDETHIGPLITNYEKLFSKPINDAINYIEQNKEPFKKYKFLTFEVIDNILLLTAIIDHNDNFINDYKEIKHVAKELGTDIMPTLWEGKLSKEQQDSILNMMETYIVPTRKDMIDWVTNMFGTYKDFPKKLISASEDYIEGIVFFFNQNGKIIEYKIVDPSYREFMKTRNSANTEEFEEHKQFYMEIYELMLNWLEKNIKHLDNDKLVSMQINFINMMNDAKIFNKLMNAGANIKINDSKTYFIQNENTIEDIQKAINKHGNIYKQLLEIYIKIFYKGKKRGFIISKEFQSRINDITNKF